MKEKKLLWSAEGRIEEVNPFGLVAWMQDQEGQEMVVEFDHDKLSLISEDQKFYGNRIYFYVYDNETVAVYADPPRYWKKTDIIKAEILAKKLFKGLNFE